MKTLGLIGGTSWVSTAEYYKLLNQMVTERLGGYNAARLLLHSVNFAEYKKLADERNTAEITRRLVRIAQTLEGAGAEAIVLCANTMHLAAAEVRTSTGIPLIHIAEATAEAIAERGFKTAALLGTRLTMEQPFYREKLAERGIETMIPNDAEREFVNQ